MLPDILLDDRPVAAFTDGTNIVAIGPEFSAPELLLQFRKLTKEFSSGDGLEEPNELTGGILRVE